MGSAIVLIAFCVVLVACMAAGLPVYIALAAGYVLFFVYGVAKGVGAGKLLSLSVKSIWSVRNIIVAFLLIGMLTASWRAAGTIPAIVTACISVVHPSIFPMAAFLMVSLMSVLTGTAFGSVATMGSICYALGQVLGCNDVILAGAIVSGAYVGDRWSPLSTSLLLTTEITNTRMDVNLRLMARRAIVPLALACVIYLALGFAFPATAQGEVSLPYAQVFYLGFWAFLPALSVIVLALFKVDVKVNMAVSVLIAVGVCLLAQGVNGLDLARWLVTGYEAPNAQIAATLDGGGLVSMLEATVIILISGTYAGLFDATGLLEGLKGGIARMAHRLNRQLALVIASAPLLCLTCNQTLGTILAHQLFKEQYPADGQLLALDIEDTVIVMAPLVPWSIACAVPIAALGAPTVCILCAFYLMLQPLWMVVRSLVKGDKAGEEEKRA